MSASWDHCASQQSMNLMHLDTVLALACTQIYCAFGSLRTAKAWSCMCRQCKFLYFVTSPLPPTYPTIIDVVWLSTLWWMIQAVAISCDWTFHLAITASCCNCCLHLAHWILILLWLDIASAHGYLSPEKELANNSSHISEHITCTHLHTRTNRECVGAQH